jgi:hypothetical protein
MTFRAMTSAIAASALTLTIAAATVAAQQRAVPRGSGGGRAAAGPGPSAPSASMRAPNQGPVPVTGHAVARPYPPSHSSVVVVPGYSAGFYPWAYGGFGYGAYWAPYDPWYHGFSVSVGFGYGHPYGYGYPYAYGYAPYFGAPYAYYGNPYGSVRLKGTPKDAGVFVDGYYAGTIEDFDGTFQRLHVEPGSHVIEIRADGYEPQSVNVRALADQTINYQAALKKF